MPRTKDTSGVIIHRTVEYGNIRTIFEREDSLTCTITRRQIRRTKDGERKTWFRRQATYTIKRKPNGTFQFYTLIYIRREKRFSAGSTEWAHNLSHLPKEILERKWGKSELIDFFPLLSHYLTKQESVDYFGAMDTAMLKMATYPIGLGLQTTNSTQDLTRLIFGRKNYRKDLVKAVSNTSLANLHIAIQFKGLVPIDWIIDFLINNQNITRPLTYPIRLRRHLVNVDLQSRKNLLYTPLGEYEYNLEDLCRLQPAPELTRVKNWEDFHNELSKIQQRGINAEIEYPKRFKKEIGDNVIVKFADNTNEIFEWGREMGNCISGYRNMALNGQVYLGGVYQDGKLLANLEVDAKTKRLVQLYGKHNNVLDNDLRETIEDLLRESKFKIPNCYRGQIYAY